MKIAFVLLAMAAGWLTEVHMLETLTDQADAPSGFEETDEFQLYQDEDEPVKRKHIEDIPGLTEDTLVETIKEAKKEIQQEEANTPRGHQSAVEQSHQMTHYNRFVPELEPIRVNALVKERTVKKLAEKLGLSHEEGAAALEGLDDVTFNGICNPILPEAVSNWVPRGFRTIDGRWNNRKRELGRANTPFSRLLRPDYSDGISKPRKAASGQDLPNARKVSSQVFKDKDRPSATLSHMSMVWGQFIDHDVALAAQPNINCPKNRQSKGECFGIKIPENDKPFQGREYMDLKRDVPTCSNMNYREHINTRSAFIDASVVYSSNPDRFKSLVDLNTPGFIIERRNPTRGLKRLLTRDLEVFCRTDDEFNRSCFKAGDDRVNEHAGLAALHTIWNREHNRIARKLRRINRHWKSKKIFFVARKIVGAMVQHITYKEFLPAILDRNTRRRFKILYKRRIRFRSRVDPSIINAFAAAAYRFGHSLVQNQMNRFCKGPEHKQCSSIPMHRFHDPTFLYQSNKGGVDSILRGLAKDKAQSVDGYFAKAVQEQLVRGPGDLSDLLAVNIQRGRDHGIPGYNKFRKFGKKQKAKTFDDLKDAIDDDKIQRLKDVYAHVNDIDLFVGGLYENPVSGGAMGPTFSAILGEQFRRLRFGDRFWYENRGQFSLGQLEQIRKVTLARVICDNADGIVKINKYVIRNRSSHLRSCFGRWRLPGINLYYWRSRRG